MKKIKSLILLLALVACIFVACTAKEEDIITDDLDKAVGEAILKECEHGYSQGECQGEGHLILGIE